MNRILGILAIVLILASCNKEEERVFEKTADERVAVAVDSLRQQLVSAPNGWVVKYRPVRESGAFNILLTFDEESNVNIRTDFGDNDGAFYNQTITYRIDNSLGLELILESYSFFSYLFEQDRATYGGEFEFNFVNNTNDALVFSSKSDVTSPTLLIFQPASAGSENLLGTQLVKNLNTLSDNLPSALSVYKLSYADKDLAFYLSLDNFQRTINFTYAAPKDGLANGRLLNFSTPYAIQGDSMIFDNPLEGSFLGNPITIPGIKFNTLTDGVINLCGQPKAAKQYDVSVRGTQASLESTLLDPAAMVPKGDFHLYFGGVSQGDVSLNGISAAEQLKADIPGIQSTILVNRSDSIMEIGFTARDENGNDVVETRRFMPTFVDNQLQLTFAESYISYGDAVSPEREAAFDVYLDLLTQNGATYVLGNGEALYELYNPCSGWSYLFFGN